MTNHGSPIGTDDEAAELYEQLFSTQPDHPPMPENEADTVTISRSEYDQLLADSAALQDVQAARKFQREIKTGLEATLPSEFVDRLLKGESLVRLWREHREMSQTTLATLSGVHRVTLNRIEAGERGASVQTFSRLAAALDVTVNDLI